MVQVNLANVGRQITGGANVPNRSINVGQRLAQTDAQIAQAKIGRTRAGIDLAQVGVGAVKFYHDEFRVPALTNDAIIKAQEQRGVRNEAATAENQLYGSGAPDATMPDADAYKSLIQQQNEIIVSESGLWGRNKARLRLRLNQEMVRDVAAYDGDIAKASVGRMGSQHRMKNNEWAAKIQNGVASEVNGDGVASEYVGAMEAMNERLTLLGQVPGTTAPQLQRLKEDGTADFLFARLAVVTDDENGLGAAAGDDIRRHIALTDERFPGALSADDRRRLFAAVDRYEAGLRDPQRAGVVSIVPQTVELAEASIYGSEVDTGRMRNHYEHRNTDQRVINFSLSQMKGVKQAQAEGLLAVQGGVPMKAFVANLNDQISKTETLLKDTNDFSEAGILRDKLKALRKFGGEAVAFGDEMNADPVGALRGRGADSSVVAQMAWWRSNTPTDLQTEQEKQDWISERLQIAPKDELIANVKRANDVEGSEQELTETVYAFTAGLRDSATDPDRARAIQNSMEWMSAQGDKSASSFIWRELGTGGITAQEAVEYKELSRAIALAGVSLKDVRTRMYSEINTLKHSSAIKFNNPAEAAHFADKLTMNYIRENFEEGDYGKLKDELDEKSLGKFVSGAVGEISVATGTTDNKAQRIGGEEMVGTRMEYPAFKIFRRQITASKFLERLQLPVEGKRLIDNKDITLTKFGTDGTLFRPYSRGSPVKMPETEEAMRAHFVKQGLPPELTQAFVFQRGVAFLDTSRWDAVGGLLERVKETNMYGLGQGESST